MGCVLCAAVLGAQPSSAEQKQRLLLPLDKQVTKSYPAIPAAQPAAKPSTDPASCSGTGTGTWCDVVPVTIQVPRAYLKDLVLTITLSWDPGVQQEVPAYGTAKQDQMYMYVWEDPPVNGTQDAAVGPAEPAKLTLVAPKSTKLNVVVRNAEGTNTGYTLSMFAQRRTSPKIYDASAQQQPDYSAPDGSTAPAPADGSGGPGLVVVAGQPAPGAAPTIAKPGFQVPDLSDGSDARLDALSGLLGTTDPSLVNGRSRHLSFQRMRAVEGANAGGLQIALWLLSPLLLLGLAAAVTLRRSRGARRV